MKKNAIYKTVQLVIFIILAAAVIGFILLNPTVYHQAASDPAMRLLCIGLWVTLGLSFLFLFLDFFYFLTYRKDYKEMDHAIHYDPMSGIANRYSCDMVVEKFLDKPLPAHMASITIDLTNIRDINHLHGHRQGNLSISDFASILNAAGADLCFVGRNGSNRFLALFENANEKKIDLFLERVSEKVANYNKNVAIPSIEYRHGIAFDEGPEVKEITQLIALSARRASCEN